MGSRSFQSQVWFTMLCFLSLQQNEQNVENPRHSAFWSEETPKSTWLKELFQKTRETKCRRGRGETGTLVRCQWECRRVLPPWKTVWRVLKTLETELPYPSAVALLGGYLKEMTSLSRRATSMPLFIAADTGTQPECPSLGRWIKKT